MAPPARSSVAVDETLPASTLHRFREGDAAAFVEIMKEYQPLVRSAAARYFKSEFDREEAVQEIWLHIFRQRQALDPTRFDSFSGWLAVLAHRRCIDLLRRPLDPSEQGEAEMLAGLNTAPEQEAAAEAAQLVNAVENFRRRLRPAWRGFFDAYFVEGLDYDEIGKRLSIGKLRCRYMRKVLALQARRCRPLMAALGLFIEAKRRDPS